MRGETRVEKEIRAELGLKNDDQPWVQFFDTAIEDKAMSAASNRTRYKTVVFIEKIPTADGLVVRDKFHRKMHKDDQVQYPEEWALYERRKSAMDDGGPNIRAIPGMDAAILAELIDLRITSCRDLLQYDGDLEELEPLRDIASNMMELATNALPQNQEIRERREALRREVLRPKNIESVRSGPAKRGLKLVDQGPAPVAVPAGNGESVETFSYSFEA